MKNAFKTAFLICSSLIGAGFASGKEIMEFFYAPYGVFYACFSVALISGSVFIILKANSCICESYLYKWGTGLFLICILSVMIAGSAEIMPYGRYIMVVAVLLTVAFGLRGIENVSVLLCPAMILFILMFGIDAATEGFIICENQSLPSPFLYAGYNVLSFPILLKNRSGKPKLTAFITGIIMLPLIVIVYVASSLYAFAEMPFLKAVGGGVFSSFMLISAMYTTAVCSAFCLKDITGGKNFSLVISVIVALLCSFSGFGRIISGGYRTFGFAGIVTVGYIMFEYLKCEKWGELRSKQDNNREKYILFTKNQD